MTGNPFDLYYRLLGRDPSAEDDAQSDLYKKLRTFDGWMHVFAPDTPHTDIERFKWRYDNGQDVSPAANMRVPQPQHSYYPDKIKRKLEQPAFFGYTAQPTANPPLPEATPSDPYKTLETMDGRIHTFRPDTPDTDIERFKWRYDNGQDVSPSANVRTPQPLRSFADAKACSPKQYAEKRPTQLRTDLFD
jgi:hypothetical protein